MATKKDDPDQDFCGALHCIWCHGWCHIANGVMGDNTIAVNVASWKCPGNAFHDAWMPRCKCTPLGNLMVAGNAMFVSVWPGESGGKPIGSALVILICIFQIHYIGNPILHLPHMTPPDQPPLSLCTPHSRRGRAEGWCCSDSLNIFHHLDQKSVSETVESWCGMEEKFSILI